MALRHPTGLCNLFLRGDMPQKAKAPTTKKNAQVSKSELQTKQLVTQNAWWAVYVRNCSVPEETADLMMVNESPKYHKEPINISYMNEGPCHPSC